MFRDMISRGIYTVMGQLGKRKMRTLESNAKNARALSEETLMRILRDNENTEYGRQHGFKNIKTIEDYKKTVPFSVYDNYAEAIERMIYKGERNLLTVYPIKHYALTSGSVNNPKKVPVSSHTLALYRDYGSIAALATAMKYYAARGKKIKHGLYFYNVDIHRDLLPNGITVGSISGTTMMKYKHIFPFLFTSPMAVLSPSAPMNIRYLKALFGLQERNVSCIVATFITSLVDIMHLIESDWEKLCDDIEHGTIHKGLEVPDDARAEINAHLRANPKRANELREAFREGFATPIVPRIWPNLTWIASIGTGGFSIYTEKLLPYIGQIPIHHVCYGASEALMGIPKGLNEMQYALIPESGFYEFIPLDYEGSDPTHTLTLDQLEPGKDYEIVLTNLSGFYRYKIQDIVRVKGYYHQTPLICFQSRKMQLINLHGEKTSVSDIDWMIAEFSKATGCEIDDYCVYADTDNDLGQYVIIVEPASRVPKPRYAEYEKIMEEKLELANPSYAEDVEGGVTHPLSVRYVQKESFLLYRDLLAMKGASANQIKPLRIITTPIQRRFFFGLIDKED